MKKLLLIIIVVVVLLFATAGMLRWRRGRVRARQAYAANATGRPAFEVRVERPIFNGARAPWEIPGVLLGLSEPGPRLDETSSGAKVLDVANNRLELIADDDWSIFIAADSEGRLAAGSHVKFPIKLGNRPLVFDCRPADHPSGQLITNMRANSGEIDGSFVVDVVTCINAKSGKTAAWPYEPLTIRGSFSGLRNERR